MEHHILVLPEHMNPHGSLFGGYLLKWIDEFAYITANIDYPGRQFVTVSLHNVVFKHQIDMGQILCFRVQQAHLGRTSVRYDIEVFGERDPSADLPILFETSITFVNIDADGNAAPIV